MKRYGNLWPQIVDFENIFKASRKAQKGKRFRPDVLVFNYNLETELIELQRQLINQTYQPGPYHTFEIQRPKYRLISAAPYRDRVVHHALCNILTPILEKTLIYHTYANRVGFGSHRALKRFTELLRSHRYVLQCDIRKFFPTLDHQILKALLRRKIKCPETLWLIDTIIDNSNVQEAVQLHFPGDDLLTPLSRRKGLPIGNLTSQLFANFYLSGFDHFIQQRLKMGQYVRFVDDFALFGNDYDVLAAARLAVEDFLATLRLQIHPIKSQLFETLYGASFVGFRILRTHTRVRSGNLQWGRQRLRYHLKQYQQNILQEEAFLRSLQSWLAHLNHGDTWYLQSKILNLLGQKGFPQTLFFTLKVGQATPASSGRFLEQQC
jgi:retron-type reverse transcriptase